MPTYSLALQKPAIVSSFIRRIRQSSSLVKVFLLSEGERPTSSSPFWRLRALFIRSGSVIYLTVSKLFLTFNAFFQK